jgi:hypothetical protein
MRTERRRTGTLAIALAVLAGCSSSKPQPPPGPVPVILEVLARTNSGRVDGVPGIQVLRNDATTGAYIETRTTDAVGRADFGVIQGPVTLSLVRPPSGAGGLTRAYTLLGLPAGTARLRLDRLPDEPGTPLAAVDVALSPALTSTEDASAWLPSSSWQGYAGPSATVIPGVPVSEQDVQDDGKVTLVARIDDAEMGTAVGCRLTADQAVTSASTSLPAGAVSLPGYFPTTGALTLDRIVAVRKGVAYALPWSPSCATAFTDATGFSAQGSVVLAGGDAPVPNYFVERRESEKRSALWMSGPTLTPGPAFAFPTADASIEALTYAAGTIHATLKGTAVRPLVAAHATISWYASATDFRIWHLYGGLAVQPASCDGTGADPACTIDQKLPVLSTMGLPPDQGDGMGVAVEAVAPSGTTTAADFWRLLAADGDAAAVLARGYTGAFRSLALRLPSYLVDVSPYVRPGWLPFGKVVGSGGISCSLLTQGACTATFPAGTQISLTAFPNSGAELTGWLGLHCSPFGTAPSVSFTLDGDATCSPQFRSIPGPSNQLNVGVISTGNGWITSDDGWISCGYDTLLNLHADCTFNYSPGTMVVLRATPSDTLNPYVATWSGDCTGSGGSTSVVMDAPRNCQVTFAPP